MPGLDRLKSAQGSYGSFGWTYDANGNRLTQTGPAATSYSYAAGSNVLASYTAGSVVTKVAIDGVGSLTALTPSSGSATTLGYNAAERLASVSIGGVAAGAYSYDAFGRRSLKVASGVSSTFLYGQTGLLLEEIDVGKSSTARLDTVYLGSQPLADINPGTGAIYWLHTDRLGTPVLATTSAKAVAWSGTYQPFGTATVPAGLFTQNLRFAGQYADLATAFYQNGFRDYAPGLKVATVVEGAEAGAVVEAVAPVVTAMGLSEFLCARRRWFRPRWAPDVIRVRSPAASPFSCLIDVPWFD